MTQPLRTIFNRFIKPSNAKAENQTKTRASHSETTQSEPILFELPLDKHEEIPFTQVQEDFQKQLMNHQIKVETQRALAWQYARWNSTTR
jgi:hypothetical protein